MMGRRLTFGKFSDRPLESVPSSYLRWLRKQSAPVRVRTDVVAELTARADRATRQRKRQPKRKITALQPAARLVGKR